MKMALEVTYTLPLLFVTMYVIQVYMCIQTIEHKFCKDKVHIIIIGGGRWL